MKHCFPNSECVGLLVSILRHYWWAVLLDGIVCIYLFCKLLRTFSSNTKRKNGKNAIQRNPHNSVLSESCDKNTRETQTCSLKSLKLFLKCIFTRPLDED